MDNKEHQGGFPSDLIDISLKDRDWRLKWVKAAHQDYDKRAPLGGYFNQRQKQHKFKEWRDYANGEQSVDIYRKRFVRKNEDGSETTYRNIDWSILKIAPKVKRNLVGMLMDRKHSVNVKSIDPLSLDARREFKTRLQEFQANKSWLESMQEVSGMQYDSPVEEGLPVPENNADIEIHMNLFYKDEFAMEYKDAIHSVLSYNNFEDIKWDISTNLVEVGLGGTRTYLDSNGFPKMRSVKPENFMSGKSEQDNFKDAPYMGEYIKMRISDLKQLAGNQFTEKEYKEIAEKIAKRQFNDQTSRWGDQNSYSYDGTEITILDLEWYSVDTWIHQISYHNGNPKVDRKNIKFFDPNISPEDYKERHPDKEIIRNDIKNVYHAMWIVGTEKIFNDGLATDMVRASTNLADTQLGFNMYRTGRNSIIAEMMPVFDNIQINWLQYQNQISRSKPSGAAIEMSAFENISMGKQGGAKMSPKEVLSMYYDTGVLIYRNVDPRGVQGAWKPIEELSGGVPDAAQQHLNFIIQMLNLLRDVSGLNEATDASTPSDELTKAQGSIAMAGTARVLRSLFHAEKMIFEETMRLISDLFMDSIKKGPVKAIIGMLGRRTWNFLHDNSDLSRYEIGITIEDEPDSDKKAKLEQYVALGIQHGSLNEEDAFMIEREENIDRAIQLMIVRKKQRMKEAQAAKQAEVDYTIQQQTASNEAATQNELLKIEAEKEAKMDLETHMSTLKSREAKEKFQMEIILAKVNAGIELTQKEKDALDRLNEIDQKGKWDVIKADKMAKARKTSQVSR